MVFNGLLYQLSSNLVVSKMPRKKQGWIAFQSSDEERRILEQIGQQTQRTKTEILRETIASIAILNES